MLDSTIHKAVVTKSDQDLGRTERLLVFDIESLGSDTKPLYLEAKQQLLATHGSVRHYSA
jgi:hypothetical protein